MANNINDTATREIRMTRILNAPSELVWEAWTNPQHIVNWWGPNGFTNTMHKMDFKEGGEWELTMHGPDGTNYPNRSIFKEIIPFEKISFQHFNPNFTATIVFQPLGEKTQIDWSMLFDTAEMRDIVVKAHGAEEGLKQNLERFDKYLSSIL